MKTALFFLLFVTTLFAQNHILITEVVVTPTDGEFVEIYNNSGSTIDLSDYYLTDATHESSGSYYYNIVTGANAGGGDATFDFNARFPNGSTIAAGEFQTIAINGTGYVTTYGTNPTYELYETSAAIPNMREALSGSIDGGSTLSNSGEVIILYYWNGQTDLVSDIDYYLWGDKAEAVDKTGISIDGPDGDSVTSTYLNDTPIASQAVSSDAAPHAFGESSQRINLVEAGETQTGGNGINGHNETSEALASSFSAAVPNPGSGPGGGTGNTPPSITNLTRTPENPGSSDEVTISANVTDDGTVTSVQLYLSINDAVFTASNMINTSGDTYEAVIDSSSNETVVKYFIQAEDDSAATSQTDTLSYTISSGGDIIPIATIRGDNSYIGKQVKIQGVITIGAGVLSTSWTDTYIQDNSGRGINVYRSGTPIDTDLKRGNLMQIEGTVEEYNGILEITNYTATLIAEDQTLPDAAKITTNQATGTYLEGTYIEVEGVVTDLYAAGGGTNIVLNDGSGAATARSWDTSGLNFNAYAVGDTIVIKGVMDIFQSAGQVLLAYQEDIEKASTGPGGDEVVITNVQQTPAVPSSSDTVKVTANVTSQNTITAVRLFTSLNSSPFDSTDMSLITGNEYQAVIDSQTTGTVVQYYIKAYDNLDNNATSATGSYTVTNPQGGVVSIADIRNNPAYIGQSVTVEGVFTIGAGILTTDWTDTYIQDNSGRGINVYRGGTPIDADLKRGNLMRVEGTVEEFGGILEITNYTATLLSANQPLPAPTELTTNEATGTSLEGTYVQVKGIITDLYSAGGGTNIVLDDGSGAATARSWDTAGLNFSAYAVGDTIAIRGVMDIYLTAGQIVLAYQQDIEKSSLGPGEEDLAVTNVKHAPTTPTSSDPVTVLADVIAKNSVTSVQLFTSFNSGAFDSSAMEISTGNTYRAVIDSQAAGTAVDYYVKAQDNSDNTITTATFSYTVSQPKVITPIADIRTDTDYIGKKVTIEAVVIIGSGIVTTGWTDVYVQDNSGRGINVYRGGIPDPSFERGNLMRIEGTVEEFSGILEIIDYTANILAVDQALPEAIKISTNEAADGTLEGTYVRIEGVILELYSAGGGTNIVLDDGTGEVTIRAWDTAGLDFSEYSVGDNVQINGVVDIYQTNGQILLAYQEDISSIEIPKSPLMLKVPNKPFVPDQGETLPIIYSAGTENAHVTVRIYDMAGRLIATPVDETGRSFEQTFEWDGTDQVNEQVTLGAYILFFEVVSNTDGATEVKTAPVVVGTILKN